MKKFYLVVAISILVPNFALAVPDAEARNEVFEARITEGDALLKTLDQIVFERHAEAVCAARVVAPAAGVDLEFIDQYLGRFRWTGNNVTLLAMSILALNAMDYLVLDVGLSRDDFPASAVLPFAQVRRNQWGKHLWPFYDHLRREGEFPNAGAMTRDDVVFILGDALRRRLGQRYRLQIETVLYEVRELPSVLSEIEQRYFALAQVFAVAVDGIGYGWNRE